MKPVELIKIIYEATNSDEKAEIENYFAKEIYSGFAKWEYQLAANIFDLERMKKKPPELIEKLDEEKLSHADAIKLMELLPKYYDILKPEPNEATAEFIKMLDLLPPVQN